MATATTNKLAQKPASTSQPDATPGTKDNAPSSGAATTQKTTVPKEAHAPVTVLDGPVMSATEGGAQSDASNSGPVHLEFIDEQLQPLPEGKYKLRPLSKGEMDELTVHEDTLRKGLPVFLLVAQALYEIQRKQLWRMYCRSFAEYCEKRLKISRTFAYMQAAAAEAMQNLLTNGEQFPLPTNERQLRPLAGLESATQTAAWKLAVERAGDTKVTGKQVEDAVKEVLGESALQTNWVTRIRQQLTAAGYEADFDQPVHLSQKEWIDFVHRNGNDVYVKLIDQLSLSNMSICLAMQNLDVTCQVIVNGAAIRQSKLEMKDGKPSRLLDPILSVFINSLGALVEYEGHLYEPAGLNKESKLTLQPSDSEEANDLRAALEPQQADIISVDEE